MSEEELEVRQVVDAVRRSISLTEIELPDEFFPAHLSVALIDAVFRSELRARTAAITERYYQFFGIAAGHTPRRKPPRPADQESLNDLIRHYDELRMEAMTNQVFGSRVCSPGTTTTKAESVLGAARALRDIGLNFLPRWSSRQPEDIEDTLHPLLGIGRFTIRLLSMYLGGKDFVRGDFPVRSFVACALGKKTIPVSQAETLVRKAAHELILSPQFLDYEIWKRSLSPAETDRTPQVSRGSDPDEHSSAIDRKFGTSPNRYT